MCAPFTRMAGWRPCGSKGTVLHVLERDSCAGRIPGLTGGSPWHLGRFAPASGFCLGTVCITCTHGLVMS